MDVGGYGGVGWALTCGQLGLYAMVFPVGATCGRPCYPTPQHLPTPTTEARQRNGTISTATPQQGEAQKVMQSQIRPLGAAQTTQVPQ
ncbi:hypothetical protein RFF05_05960 [Bengtsoniella intestinalis]|uniref:hypothetical protein n=1 Tax=Bengtsoniella intestinalis TaxID=3073143 RepID=UPI00391F8CCF